MQISLNKAYPSSSVTSLFPLVSTRSLFNLSLSLSVPPLPHLPIWEHRDLGWTLDKILTLCVLVFQSVKQDDTCGTALLGGLNEMRLT